MILFTRMSLFVFTGDFQYWLVSNIRQKDVMIATDASSQCSAKQNGHIASFVVDLTRNLFYCVAQLCTFHKQT